MWNSILDHAPRGEPLLMQSNAWIIPHVVMRGEERGKSVWYLMRYHDTTMYYVTLNNLVLDTARWTYIPE